ncbi:50S ribosomal protein L3 glutamine [Nitrosomonas stercoris]|uniref:Ribosomal protein uL3 glutamine methyltransferase n=1 Tax=Nitrosomonas stercoris TaxID=1444684 RepID=A0A4Y1YLW7_9PROT|nr:50S ribosomal protein L3 glutamine [Nitrosomonas stercoris]
MSHTKQLCDTNILQAAEELRTLRDLLRFTVSYFNQSDLFLGHGLPTTYDEALLLIMHTLHLNAEQLDIFMDATLTQHERNQVLHTAERRVTEKIPVAYLTHEAWLGDFNFYIDQRVIIPRSFIAELLQDHLSPWVTDPYTIRSGLDLCTGSGCLAILMAHVFEHAHIDAVDISSDALEVAAINIKNYELTEQIYPIHSDLFAQLQGKKYDLIISNPPYVNAASMAALPAEYRHEPTIALAGGLDGLDIVQHILQEAPNYLTEDGLLIIEIGHNQAKIEQIFPHLPCIWLETSAGNQFVLMVKRSDLTY